MPGVKRSRLILATSIGALIAAAADSPIPRENETLEETTDSIDRVISARSEAGL
jgi:hypothetical protein